VLAAWARSNARAIRSSDGRSPSRFSCLHKDRKDRLADIADARLEIVDALAAPSSGASAAVVDRRRASQRFALTAITAFVIGGFTVWVTTGNSQQGSAASVVRFAIHDTNHVIVSRQQGDMALSPDGRTLAFVGFGDSGPRLWLRQFDAVEGQALPGTDGAVSPSWSPDGRWLAFVALGQIKKVAMSGGPPQLVVGGTALGGGKSLAWGPDGTILYATNARGFWGGTASGGTPTRVVAPARDQVIESPESFQTVVIFCLRFAVPIRRRRARLSAHLKKVLEAGFLRFPPRRDM
jgi:hypothetical protein